uniref:E4 protein n=1 Tax=Human papillomavirus TaxID=10566 RepID=A0A385PIU4_9PAPI|nr:MAG: E4 protein [Human papillomavirus]
MKMVYTLLKPMVIEHILPFLSQMQRDMATQENGQFILKIHQLSHLPATPSGPQGNPPKGNGTNLQPPATPRPHRRASALDDYRGRQYPPLRKPLTFDLEDEETNKENYPPQQKEEDQYSLSHLLTQLLRKLEHDIDQLSERVLRDFNDFKLTLGIPQS